MSRPARDRAAQQPPPTTLAGFPTLTGDQERLYDAITTGPRSIGPVRARTTPAPRFEQLRP